ncbi:reverse transcriptase [Cucumis melo var. makuwa]|uniref:Reverse transcriptase n=1 Tax=Cucumis melo var. makuwa TaxID=1194695 RepID=A0A5D3BVM0_CUCMM|nr:reverse transcriptase [Cucumis melo var. makuwa]TYK02286.1 reverse transcriptase [Cucumis melo var. makuwa]
MLAPMHSSKIDVSMQNIIREFIQKDPFAQAVVPLAKVSKTRQFWVEEDLLLSKGNRLYVPRVAYLRKKLLHECHDTLWVGHPSWVAEDVCAIEERDKVEKLEVTGLLEPLPILTRLWESVSMDFITHLPKVGDLEAILVIIDWFSKYATFIFTTKLCSAELTT